MIRQMYLIQVLLPLYDNAGKAFKPARFARVRQTLAHRFGGVTIYSRAPAEGLFNNGGNIVRDDLIVFEVMAEALDRRWWGRYRASLEKGFRQEQIVVRVSEFTLL